ncbi:PepSY domain-containing protein [Paraneptunicella aestuarii]|uniref:PepSY-associated TM helix domain-containing protein n=1 Tax=Paraneptunicella aestuarii TaxID=2831148 RepID=UPI001E315C80|nr:PepSY domain-containing protein [Paraneptunicella aestuarii]UAA38333.1 PepSY domain-containing protein [Paraneptunicella aestuarii]
MSSSVASKRIYATLWRWHFYAGIFCIPFVIILSISGAIYLFKPQLDGYAESRFVVKETAQKALPNEQIQAALNALPGSRFISYRLPASNTEAVRLTLRHQGEKWYAYVNPYSLEVMDTLPVTKRLSEWSKELHGELLMGKTGSIFVELAGSWAIVLVCTGLYLWWPRSTKGLAGVLYPRLSGGRRQFWRDLHAVTGIWVSGLALFLLITGLPWTTVWGNGFKSIRSYYSQSISQPATEQSWSTDPAQARMEWMAKATDVFDLKPEIYQQANQLNLSAPVELSVSNAKVNQWKAASLDQNRPNRSTAWIDNNGKVVRTSHFADKSTLDKAINIGIAAHEGQLFGLANQLLGVFTAICLLILSGSGFWLWLKRKPTGALGAPPSQQTGRFILVSVWVASILLPVVFASLTVVWAIEWLILSRIPKFRLYFNIPAPR